MLSALHASAAITNSSHPQSSAQTSSLRSSRAGHEQSYIKEPFDSAELGWKLAHASFSDVLQRMQLMIQIITEAHTNQQLAAHRSVQKEKMARMLLEAQLLEREEMEAAHAEAFRVLDQKHQELRQRYVDLCSTLDRFVRIPVRIAVIALLFPVIHCEIESMHHAGSRTHMPRRSTTWCMPVTRSSTRAASICSRTTTPAGHLLVSLLITLSNTIIRTLMSRCVAAVEPSVVCR